MHAHAAEAKDQQEFITPLPSLLHPCVTFVAAIRAITCDMLAHREDRAVQHRRCGPCTYPHLIRALMVTTSWHDLCSACTSKFADFDGNERNTPIPASHQKLNFEFSDCCRIFVSTMARSRSPARRRRAPTTAAAETPLPPTPKSGGRSANTTAAAAAAAATPAPQIKQAKGEDETWGPEAGVWSQRGPA